MGSLKGRKTKLFKRILIANRGEIACRIQQTCHRLGIETIAVGSTVDEGALHMQMADKAVVIGPPEPSRSYLNGAAILHAALRHGAEAIHPGYGFLSENPDFAVSVREARLTFIGPSTEAIQAMGSKSKAKAIAQSVNVPVIPGYEGKGDLVAQAHQLGFPLMIKATWGGGGKGMRRVDTASEFEGALAACQREAKAAFGNDQVLLEKYLVRPRHVEVQILGDSYGTCIAFSDRDCSLQRRHQKIIEEAPAPHLPDNLRRTLHEAAVAVAKCVHYEGAGTVEFLVAGKNEFYFLEMNTRLQVEHPVTEMILGLDLVEWQLRIAAGEPLLLEKNDQKPRGHAMEARLYAEDGNHHFLPSTGIVTQFDMPEGSNIRVDTGIRTGDTITPYYDPMVAKIISWGENREAALKGLANALCNTHVKGVKTNINFLLGLLNHPDVLKTGPDTGFIDRYVDEDVEGTVIPKEAYLLAALWVHHQGLLGMKPDPWTQQDGWRLNAPAIHYFHFAEGVTVDLVWSEDGAYLRCGGKGYQARHISVSTDNQISAKIEGDCYQARVIFQGKEIQVHIGGALHRLRRASADIQGSKASGPAPLTAPMPGRVVSVMVVLNEPVKVGQPLLILEAMKMEHTVRAPYAGIVDGLPFSPGDFCEEGVELIQLRGSSRV